MTFVKFTPEGAPMSPVRVVVDSDGTNAHVEAEGIANGARHLTTVERDGVLTDADLVDLVRVALADLRTSQRSPTEGGHSRR